LSSSTIYRKIENKRSSSRNQKKKEASNSFLKKALVVKKTSDEEIKEEEDCQSVIPPKVQNYTNKDEEIVFLREELSRTQRELETLKSKYKMKGEELKKMKKGQSKRTKERDLICMTPETSEKIGLLELISTSLTDEYKMAKTDYNQLIFWLSLLSNLLKSLRNVPRDPKHNVEISGIDVYYCREESRGEGEQLYSSLYILMLDVYQALLMTYCKQIDSLFPSKIFETDVTSIMESQHLLLEEPTYITFLKETYECMKSCSLLASLISQFFNQIFFYINGSLFNLLLRNKELCSCDEGLKIKFCLSNLEEWACSTNKDLLFPLVKKNFNHLREASNVLVLQKCIFADESIMHHAFSTLNPGQIKRLLQINHEGNSIQEKQVYNCELEINNELLLNWNENT